MQDFEARKDRLAARREATREFTSALDKAEALDDLESFIKKPTCYGPRRPDVEKPMVLRTAKLLYSGHHPGLRLGAAIGLYRGYSKTKFRSLEKHAAKLLTEELVGRLNDLCPLNNLGDWLSYSKHLQGNEDIFVLSSLEFAWAYASEKLPELLPRLIEITERYKLNSFPSANPQDHSVQTLATTRTPPSVIPSPGSPSDKTCELEQPQPKRRKTDAKSTESLHINGLQPAVRVEGGLSATMEPPQTPAAQNQGSVQPDSPEQTCPVLPRVPPTHGQAPQRLSHAPAYALPFDHEPATPSVSPIPSLAYDSARERRVHQPGEAGRLTPISHQGPTALQGRFSTTIPTGNPPVLLHLLRPPSSDLHGTITMLNNLSATSDLAWTPCTFETSSTAFHTPLPMTDRITPVLDNIPDAESSQFDVRNHDSVQPEFSGQPSSRPWNAFHQRDQELVLAAPQFQLATWCWVPDTAASIAFAMKGNVDGLKDLFSRGLACPRDVSSSRGFSLIRWALYGGLHHSEAVVFLINQGAHVDDESYGHVFDFAFRNKFCSETELKALGCITSSRDTDWVEEQHFSRLHRIILCLSSDSLTAVLEEDPDTVNAMDAQGRTALDWATARAQLSEMSLLINQKSNVNGMDRSGRATILHAVDSHNYEAVRMLLEAGADPNPKVPEGQFRSSPLKAASFGGLVEMVKLLLQYGAEIDAYNPEGHTALHAAAITQNIECANVLLEAGASLGDVAGKGLTPLMTAIIHNSHAVLKLFVDGRYELAAAAQIEASQVLALIAEHADAETMSIILSSLPMKLALRSGGDSFDVCRGTLRQRRDHDTKLRHAFEELLSSIVMAKKEDAAMADGCIPSGMPSHLCAEPSFSEELGGRLRY